MSIVKKARQLFLRLAKQLQGKRHAVLLLTSISFSWCIILLSLYSHYLITQKREVLGIEASSSSYRQATLISPVALIPTETLTPTPTVTPTSTPIPTATPMLRPTPTPSTPSNQSQYTAQKINDVTWRVSNVSNDNTMASPQEIYNALNSYRTNHGLSSLSWDVGLASYAQSRADLFTGRGSLDSHAGFNEFMKNDGFSKVGFNGLGENSAYLSGPMNGDHIIRNIFGADSSHDGNQLDPSWTNVGVGVNGVAVNVNFGKNKK